MLVADVVRTVTQLVAGTLLVMGQAEVWHLVVLQAIYGGAQAFFTPALIGLVPATTAPDRLQQANALLSLSWSVMGIAGPAIGGVLVALASPGVALIVDGLTFAVSVVTLWLLQIERAPRATATRSFISELGDGIAVVRSRTWLWTMIVYFGFFNLAAWPALFVLGPYEAKTSLGGAAAWATVLTAGSLGAVSGGCLRCVSG